MSLAKRITPLFLRRLEKTYPATHNPNLWKNPWYLLASVAFSASNEPEGVPIVFQHAIENLKSQKERMVLARKTREALFQSGFTSGYSKAINGLVALDAVMPEGLKEREPSRVTPKSIADHAEAGKAFFQQLHGDSAKEVQGLLDRVYPDLGWFSSTIGYGLVHSSPAVSEDPATRNTVVDTTTNTALTPLETSYVMIAALIASDTPRQLNWYFAGARRAGASVEDVKLVREMVMRCGKLVGLHWKHGVPAPSPSVRKDNPSGRYTLLRPQGGKEK
ncbi:hypothetical protein VNI00_006065 [Paramarasmius palmivorus]|uniref:Carboxymuconolactone decarboxylase-like domain-containing protein n=1 Tax=Paramarasmius palmivorus TaxID=297713 RepID=A0AAW0DDI8_9AGAR